MFVGMMILAIVPVPIFMLVIFRMIALLALTVSIESFKVCFYLPLHFRRMLLTILTCPSYINIFKSRPCNIPSNLSFKGEKEKGGCRDQIQRVELHLLTMKAVGMIKTIQRLQMSVAIFMYRYSSISCESCSHWLAPPDIL